jgi:predicted DCC family thiol-disulfide oxidoreductase YuxK
VVATTKPELIVFYDGECGFCDRSVQFVLRHDREQKFRFAALQGETANELIGEGTGDSQSVIVLDKGTTYFRSSAALRILWHLGGFWRLFSYLQWIPAPIRDGVYRWIASNRCRLFGKVDACRLPAADQRSRFLP